METMRVRHAILGAGAMGAAAAYHLARRGEPVALVEQYALGHNLGSSHGDARIVRHSYAEARYARLMPEAFRAWRELEAEAAQTLYVRTGGVSFGPPEVGYVARVAENLEAAGVAHRRMTGRELRRDQPAFVVPDAYDAVFEPDAGLVAAAKAVATQVEMARRLGGARTTVLENRPIRRLDLEAGRPTLVGDGLRIEADRLIVAAGAWVGRLLPELAGRLRPTRQQVLYLQPKFLRPFLIGELPVFIFMGANPGEAFYGMPHFLGGGVKVARHGGPETEPDFVDRSVAPEAVEEVRYFLRGHLPALADAPLLRGEVCLYTVAPDEHFVVGPWPARPEVIVASPCSGHGFKFSCLIGRALADLATNGTTDALGGICGWSDLA